MLVWGAAADDPYTAVVLLCACFGFNQITEAAYWSTAIAVAGEHAAAASGVMNTGGNVVGFIGGMLVPVTATWLGWTIAMSTGAGHLVSLCFDLFEEIVEQIFASFLLGDL
jgi:hypothetical protein